jgi:hypothetical protein
MENEESKFNTIEFIECKIFFIRGHKIILDSDLAAIYNVPTKVLNQAVKRNIDRFPEDFMFQLTSGELYILKTQASIAGSSGRSQIVTGSQKHRDPRFLPFAFTEHGAIMAANVLKNKRAAILSVYVVRAFVMLREALAMHKDLAQKLTELERKFDRHDSEIQTILEILKQLMQQLEKPKRPIGFIVEEPKPIYRLRKKK